LPPTSPLRKFFPFAVIPVHMGRRRRKRVPSGVPPTRCVFHMAKGKRCSPVPQEARGIGGDPEQGRGVCHLDPLAPSRLLTHFFFDCRPGSLRRSNYSWAVTHYNSICLKGGGYYSAPVLVGRTYYSATPDGLLLRGPHFACRGAHAGNFTVTLNGKTLSEQ